MTAPSSTFDGLNGPYGTIVVDPPWSVLRPGGGTWAGQYHEQGKARSRARVQPYDTMSLDDIKVLPVTDLADDCCHLYLWTVNAYVPAAYDVARAWGFTPSTLLTWCKKPMGKGPGGLYSITTEFILYAKRGPEKRRALVDRTWFDWPRRGQSVKPDEFYEMAKWVSPAPRVDLFARTKRPGWDSWGDEV